MFKESDNPALLEFDKPVTPERLIDFLQYLSSKYGCRVSYDFKKMGNMDIIEGGVLHRPGSQEMSFSCTDLKNYKTRPTVSCSSKGSFSSIDGIASLVLFMTPGYNWDEIENDEQDFWRDIKKSAEYFFDQD